MGLEHGATLPIRGKGTGLNGVQISVQFNIHQESTDQDADVAEHRFGRLIQDTTDLVLKILSSHCEFVSEEPR